MPVAFFILKSCLKIEEALTYGLDPCECLLLAFAAFIITYNETFAIIIVLLLAL